MLVHAEPLSRDPLANMTWRRLAVLLPERFRAGCAFGGRNSIRLSPDKSCDGCAHTSRVLLRAVEKKSGSGTRRRGERGEEKEVISTQGLRKIRSQALDHLHVFLSSPRTPRDTPVLKKPSSF